MIIPFLRLIFALLLPVAAFVILKTRGWEPGGWWAIGMACGIFVYHYLQWALFETDRVVRNAGVKPRDRSWIFVVFSIAIVGVLVRGNFLNWIVEQFLLEVVAFSAGLALLAIFKAAGEGKEGPWWLVLLVFVAPPAALIWKVLPFWIGFHEAAAWWTWLLFAAAFLSGMLGFFLKMKPYAMGEDFLAEPLSGDKRTILAVAWFIFLFAGACVMTAL